MFNITGTRSARSSDVAKNYQREHERADTSEERIAINARYTLHGSPVTDILAYMGRPLDSRIAFAPFGAWGTLETCPHCGELYPSDLHRCPECLAHNECYETENPNVLVAAMVCVVFVAGGVLAWVFVN